MVFWASRFHAFDPTWKWIILIGVFLWPQYECKGLVSLQTDGVARAESGLTWQKTMPSLRVFSFCVRLFSYRSRYSDYFFSYATDDNDNELSFHLKYDQKEFRMACCSKRVFHIASLDLSLLKWMSFCVAVNLTARETSFVHTYGNDQIKLEDSLKNYRDPLIVQGGGKVILGQDQDEPGGGTDKEQSFNGLMADLFLIENVVLSLKEMQDYVQCNTESVRQYPLLMSFLKVSQDFVLGVSTKEYIEKESCPKRTKTYSIFTEARNYEEASQFCSIVNGDLALPLDEEDNKALFSQGSQSAAQCTSFDKANGLWVGVTWDHNQDVWKNRVTQNEAAFRNFDVELTPASDEVLCVIAQTLPGTPDITPEGNWDIENCKRTLCTACEFESPRPLKIRGLCAESIFDRDYYIYGRVNARPIFNGKRWTRIIWMNSTSNYDYTWVMHQILEPTVEARMITKSQLDYPIGVNEFEVTGDKCPGRRIQLKLTSCTSGMYTCNNGACVNINKRCNLELDCADHSDELNCGTLALPPGYEKRLPPPKVNSKTPAMILIDINIRLIRTFSLMDSYLEFDLVITRSWFDSRVRYKNLHSNRNLNLIDDLIGNVWYPDVTLLGSDNSIAGYKPLFTSGWGERLTEPEPDDSQLLNEDVFYSGLGNPLMLERESTVTLMCTFDLTLYPFDTQQCSLKFYVSAYTQDYVINVLRKLEFSGTRRLLEYEVTRIQHEPILYYNKSGQEIKIVVTNLYGYYISSAYIPTFLLVIISYLTFYFSLEDFTNRVMVSLTSLLVLAALFSQIASGLPKTAYMKLIDIWFIFCILSDFTMVMLLVIINTIIDHQSDVTKIIFFDAPVTPKKGFKQPCKLGFYDLNPRKFNRVAQVILPIFLGLFCIVYFGYIGASLGKVKETD